MNEMQKFNLIKQTIKIMSSIGLNDYKTEQLKFYLKEVIIFVLIAIPPSTIITIFNTLNIYLGFLPAFLLYSLFFAIDGYFFKKDLNDLYENIKNKLSEDFLVEADFEIIEDSVTRNRLIEFIKEFGVYPYSATSSRASEKLQTTNQSDVTGSSHTNYDLSLFNDDLDD